MMLQFVVWVMGGERWLMRIDTSYYDFMYGFCRPVTVLED